MPVDVFGPPAADAAMITAFVGAMMLTVEYLSVQTRGAFQKALERPGWWQYAGAALLGAVPGCLGSFTVVSLYAHGVLPIGAVITAMIATSGDEAFVMFTLFPGTALRLTLGLVAVGLIVGPVVDAVLRQRTEGAPCPDLVLHRPNGCRCWPGGTGLLHQWKHPSPVRLGATGAMAACAAGIAVGFPGSPQWGWVRVTLLLVCLFGTFVVVTVPEHFLRDHLWRHVVLRHVPRLYAWTFGALVAVEIVDRSVGLGSAVRGNPEATLGLAAAIGLIPESGPHLVFVTQFAQGLVPFSVLFASSLVQDGHGMLPLLAESRSDFVLVKVVQLLVGLGLGALLLAGGC